MKGMREHVDAWGKRDKGPEVGVGLGPMRAVE